LWFCTKQKQKLLPLTSAEELPLAQEALRLGDREMDLAFAVGVREAQEHPAALSAEAKEAQIRLQDAENSLDRDNSRVAQLTSALAKATGARADSLDNQLQQAKVQVELDQDEVDNAKQELILAGGDAQGRIEELTKEHEVVVDNKANVREYVFIDAHTGKFVDQITGFQDGLYRRAYDGANLPTAPPSYPNAPYRVEGQPFPTASFEANNMITASQKTYDFYLRLTALRTLAFPWTGGAQ